MLESLSVTFRFFHHSNTESTYTDLPLSLTFTFQLLVDSFNQLLPPSSTPHSVCGFIYRDSDGDVVTVRSPDEMSPLLHSVVCFMKENSSHAFNLYPKFSEHLPGLVIPTKNYVPSISSGPEQCLGPKIRSQIDTKRNAFDFQASMLNKYEIKIEQLHFLEHLSSGNGRNVYKASYLPNRMIVAVKQIPLDVCTEEQNAILSELNVLWLCDSPYMIKFHGAIHMNSSLMFITEYMDGKSLQASTRVQEYILGKIAFCVIEGIKYLWTLKILHRDVKPSNILVNTRGEIKFCDFGVSTQLVKSMARTFIGTNAYMAPERIRGEEYSIQSEIWSIGITVMELAIGRFPYEFETRASPMSPLGPLELIQSILNEPPPRLPTNEHSNEVREFVGLSMEKEPSHRPNLEELSNLGFVLNYKDVSNVEIATWVRSREKRSVIEF
ncbi:Dual specificity mitogen-activated protein kinase kinase 5 [Oopsacas minuta]|uniref:mitogen-activated protein kinase kinase n=1 Tax=Oopsacas minuta TaxID=111878 RepID=A0AAV7K499_9METZ|nr:Dual specificity mitogen-activated protein kinase kinase 5 [Oopsacas minuta]